MLNIYVRKKILFHSTKEQRKENLLLQHRNGGGSFTRPNEDTEQNC